MSAGAIVTAVLLGLAVAICLFCALGVLVMRTPYQRLNFPSSAASLAMALIVAAIFLDDPGASVRIKTLLIAGILFFTNGVLSHVTARSVFIKQKGRWRVEARDGIARR